MRCTLLLVLVGILLLTACGGDGIERCSTPSDCTARDPQAFTPQCIEGECIYQPIPNVAGNGLCDPGETECSAPQDCGQCTGNVAGSQYLTRTCHQDQCLADVSPGKIKPIYLSNDARSGGDTFQVQTTYNNPFNLKKDLFRIQTILAQTSGTNHYLINAELKGITSDRRSVVLARKDINRPIWENQINTQDLILTYPGAELEGSFQTLTLTVRYRYTTRSTTRESQFTIRYPSSLTYVNPDVTYPCPNCDDNNRGTRDYCGPETNYFCYHEPLPGVCGNGICDGGETQCSCPQDCGQCTGSAGSFVERTCRANTCIGIPKPGMQAEPNSLFDERRLGPIQLTNTYSYNNPFDTAQDTFTLDFDVYSMGEAKQLTIETIRLLDGSQIIAEKDVNQQLSSSMSIDVEVPSQTQYETERNVNLGVWYSYKRGESLTRANYNKNLGRITFITLEP